MKTRSDVPLFLIMIVFAFAAFSCSDRNPVSPESMEGSGLLTLDLRLSKVSEQTIDKVLVVAEHPSMEPVSGELTITGKTATGSLEVSPGKWLVIVEAFSGNTLCYHGEIGPVDVAAGKSTDIPSMKLHATRDLVADRIFIADTDWNELDRVEEGQEILLVLVYKNTGSAEAAGWREEAFLDGAERGHTDNMAVGAGQTKRIGQKWTALAGTHTVEFRLDTENVIGESDETNNTISLTFTIQPPVDLVAEKVYIRWSETKDRVDPKNLLVGSVVDLVLSCRNEGSTDATGWRFEAYLDEVLLCSMNDVSIPAGKEWLLWCPDWAATEGPHKLELRLDTGDVIREKDETNNTASLIFTVRPSISAHIDLIAEEVFITRAGENVPIDPNSLTEGDQVDLNLNYRNAGSADATGWRYEVYLDGALIGYLDDVSRPATETGILWYQWTAEAGPHTVEFRLDTGEVVEESDETNNTTRLSFTVRPSISDEIDLIAEEIFITRAGENVPIDPNSLTEGDQVDLTLNYRNAGSADATGWRFEVYLDGALIGYLDDVSRPAAETGILWYQWTAEAGMHTVEFRLDTGDVVRESDETNNTAELFFTVRSSGPSGGIIAGQSTDGVQLGFTKDQVIETLGPPDERDEDGDFWYHSGIGAWFNEYGRAYVILVTEPYPGITERGIGLGSPASQIVDKYGTDYTIKILDEFPAYWYAHSGIAFSLDESNICVSIGIFAVGLSGPGGGIVAGESIEDIEIGFTRIEVIDEVGEPLSVDEDGSFRYDSAVVQFDDNHRVWFITVVPPYSGITEQGIGLGAVASEVKRKYGADFLAEPMPEFSAYMFTYVKLGIAFMFDQESNICIAIAVFRPPAAKAGPDGAPSEAQETMRALWSASLN
jgi:subtilase family serine protease